MGHFDPLIVPVGYAGYLVERFNEQFVSTFRNFRISFFDRNVSFHFHLLIIRNRWLEVSSILFLFQVFDFCNILIFLTFFDSSAYYFSNKFHSTFQFVTSSSDFWRLIMDRKWCEAQLRLSV